MRPYDRRKSLYNSARELAKQLKTDLVNSLEDHLVDLCMKVANQFTKQADDGEWFIVHCEVSFRQKTLLTLEKGDARVSVFLPDTVGSPYTCDSANEGLVALCCPNAIRTCPGSFGITLRTAGEAFVAMKQRDGYSDFCEKGGKEAAKSFFKFIPRDMVAEFLEAVSKTVSEGFEKNDSIAAGIDFSEFCLDRLARSTE